MCAMSEMCWRCWRPKSNCLCPWIKEADTGITFVILMHPKEAYHQRTGTGRLAALSLKDSQIIIGIDFTENGKLNALLSDPAYYPVLLYPGKDAITANDPDLREHLAGGRRLLVIVVDATWLLAKKMVRLSRNLHALPKISFTRGYRSEFTFKREPKPDYISTIESCYYLVKELQEVHLAKECDVEPMMQVFRRMVSVQLACEAIRKEKEGPGPQHAFKMRHASERKPLISR